MEKDIEDKDILRNVINALNLKRKEFHVKIGYRQTIIYKILNGDARVSNQRKSVKSEIIFYTSVVFM
jgi:predicted transcriptional regulator